MSIQNFKIIYSLKIHLELQRRGFRYISSMPNPANQRFTCWIYDATPELIAAFDELVRG